MALLQSFKYGTEKTPVVFDFGHAYTKIGFAGETSPRVILRTQIVLRKTGHVVKFLECPVSDEDLRQALVDFFYAVYVKHLLVNPYERRVVIVESLLNKSVVRNMMANILFQHFDVLSLIFVPGHLVALMPLGIPSGLVVDVGYHQATVIPVYENTAMLKGCEMLPLGSKAVHDTLEAQLLDKATITTCQQRDQVGLSSVMEELDRKTLEDITVRCCFVTTMERSGKFKDGSEDGTEVRADETEVRADETEGLKHPPDVDYPLRGNAILHIKGQIREQSCETFFHQDADESSLANLVLNSLLETNVDIRKCLAENLVLMGGSVSLRGFTHRLLTELKHLSKTHPKYQKIMQTWSFKVHPLPAQPNCLGWLGGAMFAGLEVLSQRSLSREMYKQTGTVPDWCSLAEAEEEKPSVVERSLQNVLAQST